MIEQKMLGVAKRAAFEAGKIHLHHFLRAEVTAKKTPIDLVTNADFEADRAIRSWIERIFPSHGIVSEELASKPAKSPYTWYIDPLDGTNNYAHGYPHFCVSIGIVKNNEPVIGVVYNPIMKELFWAVKGKGAFLNKTKIKVSSTETLKKSMVATGFPYKRKPFRRNILAALAKIYDNTMGIRRGGAAALDMCYVAAGRLDAYYEHSIKPWDIMAGMVICREAGAKVTTMDNRQLPLRTTNILVAPKRLHPVFVDLLKR